MSVRVVYVCVYVCMYVYGHTVDREIFVSGNFRVRNFSRVLFSSSGEVAKVFSRFMIRT